MTAKKNKNDDYSYILDKNNYNDFFQFFDEKLEYRGLHKILTDYFPIDHGPSGVIVKYLGYTCDYNKYNEKIFTSSYLSHTAKLYFKLEFTIFNPESLDPEIVKLLYDRDTSNKQILEDLKNQNKKYKEHIESQDIKVFDYLFTVANVPIKVGRSYFVINGTKKIMIYQLIKIGGFYYQIDKEVNGNLKYLDSNQVGPVALVRLVSLSGSRVVIKVNRRGILYAYVNNSDKIKIATFFDLIPEEKLLRYVTYYKSQLNISIFKNTKSHVVKHALLFADSFDFEITNKGAFVYCSKEQVENYLIAKWNKYEYYEDKQLVFIPLSDLYNCIIAKKNKCNFISKKNKQIEIKEGGVITDAIKAKIALLDDSAVINLTLLCFPNSMNIICRSFLHYIDKDIVENLETHEPEQDKQEVDEEYESDDDSDGYKSSSIHDDYEDNEDSSSTSISYVIDEMIRKRINQYLNVQYSANELKFTEEDFILAFILFNKMMLEDHEKKDYDALGYKIVKCPETFISNLILRAVKKLQNNLKYLGNTKIRKYENTDTVEEEEGHDYPDLKHIINEFLSAYSVSSDIRKLFGGTYPIVQFLEETNILSVWAHTRRISVFNLVNSDKHQASFEGRDINPTYFGKICPTETPEGRNVGLVNSIALNALISEYGFILTPYYVVKKGKVTDTVHLLTSEDEKDKVMACFQKDFEKQEKVLCRYNGESYEMNRMKVDYIDYNNCSMLSIASCLIPGIQHNDARRALMGANMQRQALPLIRKEAPIVGTGVEHLVVKYSNNIIYNKKTKPRIVTSASAVSVITADKDTFADFEVFHIDRFMKTNMKTCNHMTTLVKKGDILHYGDAIASGSCIDGKELAIGQNVKVAIVSVYGYEYEDSILISDVLKEKGIFASVHKHTTEVKSKEDLDYTEEFTKDKIEKLRKIKYLDDRGIIKVGTKINFKNEVIVGRGVPRRDSPSLEDGVLSVIFGQDIPEYKDISARSNEEFAGVVTDIHYFNKLTNVQDSTYCTNLTDAEIHAQKCILKVLVEKFIATDQDKYYSEINEALSLADINRICVAIQRKKVNKDKKVEIQNIIDTIKERTDNHEKTIKMSKCCNPENNVTEYVKITTTEKRIIEPGDKLSGRHGNKGVVSHIMERASMPFTDDGEIVDIAINPIGIPNRLNLAQILESTLGRTSYELSKQVRVALRFGESEKARKLLQEYLNFKVHRDEDLDVDKAIEIIENDGYINLKLPVFDSISFDELKDVLKLLGISEDATVRLNCGITGEPFNRKVHLGIMYIMKLNHTAVEKRSVRETGGYSAILEQPLPRKSNYGGQRFGEMEVWAVEAHGAAHTLLEILGPKSDNTTARNKLYQSIFTRGYRWTKDISADADGVENYEDQDLGLSATVNVLIKYLNGVCIKLEFIKRLGKAIEQNTKNDKI